MLRCLVWKQSSHGLFFYTLTVFRHFSKVLKNERYLILRCRVFSFLFRLESSEVTYVILRLRISETQLDILLGCNAISSSTSIVSLSRFEANQFYELEQFIFAAYVSHLSSIRSDFQYHSISLRIHTGSVYRDPAKFTSLSFSESISTILRLIVENDPDTLLDRK